MKDLALFVHIASGTLALLSGAVAMVFRERPRRHVSPGKVYFYSMAGVFVTALYLSIVGDIPFLLMVGVFSFYLAWSGYRAKALRGTRPPTRYDWGALGLMVLFGTGLVGWGVWMLTRGETFGTVAVVFGAVGLAFAYQDAHRFRKATRGPWLRPHIRGMMGSYIAATTAFVVTNVTFLPPVVVWLLPTAVLTPLIVRWVRQYATSPGGRSAKGLPVTLLACGLALSAFGQPYLEKQTRHRFAQSNFGFDVQTNFGGQTSYLVGEEQRTLSLAPQPRGRFILGGTHFWGHADFYVAIPVVATTLERDGQEVRFNTGVETVFKYYPWRVERGRVRPYAGASLSPFRYQQNGGAELTHPSVPLVAGLTYAGGRHLLELGLTWNYAHRRDYYIDRSTEIEVSTPPVYVALAYRYTLETTLSAEPGWESGRTAEVTEKLAAAGRLDGFFVGVGVSSAWWLKRASYNETARPFLPGYGINTMLDVGAGYYWHRPDLNVAVGYRGYTAEPEAYGVGQRARRRSVLLEATKYLFDYHGFAPFVGPALSYEQLRFEEEVDGTVGRQAEDERLGYGLTFGWDIRPNRLQTFLLRTNLRWFPNLDLAVADAGEVSFDNVEFNFIQLVVFPGRLF